MGGKCNKTMIIFTIFMVYYFKMFKNNHSRIYKIVSKRIKRSPMNKNSVLILFFLLILFGCKSKKSTTSFNNEISNVENTQIQLLQNLYDDGNIVLSPLSIKSAMSMLYLGSSGETEKEISQAFEFSNNTSEFHQNTGHKLKSIETDTANTVVSLANGLWLDRDYQVKASYVDYLKKYYHAKHSEVSFKNQMERTKANKEINQWLSEETRNKIKDLIPENAFTPLTRLVLVNAVYFKSDWLYPFNKNQNTKEDFTIPDEKKVETTFMNQKKQLKLLEMKKYRMLEMPYVHEKFSMIFILPDEPENINSLISSFRISDIDSLLNQQPTMVDLKLPKYTIEYKTPLNTTLKKMGMEKAFTNDANFREISDNNDLKVTDVYHGAYIDVNEKGTEAAGATGVIIGLKSAFTGKIENFHLNRPFLFMIYHKPAKQTLFSGVLSNPI